MDDSKGILLQLFGGLFAPVGPEEWKKFGDTVKFIEFDYVTGLYIRGAGLVDGHGKGWWDISCRDHPELKVYSRINCKKFWQFKILFSILFTHRIKL